MCQLKSKFNSLADREWGTLVRVMIARGVRTSDATDVVQDSLARTYCAFALDAGKAEEKLADAVKFRAFVLTVAKNLYIDHIRGPESQLTRTFSELERDGETGGIEATISDNGNHSPLDALIHAQHARLAAPALENLYCELAQHRSLRIGKFVRVFHELEGDPKDTPAERILRLGAYIYHLSDDRPAISNRILDRQVGPSASEKVRNKQRKANDGVCRKLKKILDQRFKDLFGRAPESGRKPYGKSRRGNRGELNLPGANG